jgi:hypothetical protein
MEISNNTLLNFPEDVLFEIFKHFGIREREKSLCLVCKLFHVTIKKRLSKYMIFCVSPPEKTEYYQRNREFFSGFFMAQHKPLLEGIKVDKEITFLTKDRFLYLCKNPPPLTSIRNTLLKLEGFYEEEIHELLEMARNSFHITILSLGEKSQLTNKFPKICKETVPNLEILSLSSFKISETLWELSELPLRKFNMLRMTCELELLINMPCSLRELYIKYQQGKINPERPHSNFGIILIDCDKLDKW